MHRTDGAGATVDGMFTQGNPGAGVPATTVTSDWLNAIQEEVGGVVEASGAALSKPDNTQLLKAISALSGRVVSTIAQLKALDKTKVSRAFVLGYWADGDAAGGPYYLDAGDVASADNNGTIIVAVDGGRWKLAQTQGVTPEQFGCKGDGVTLDTTRLQAWVNVADAIAVIAPDPDRVYLVDAQIALKSRARYPARGATVKQKAGTNLGNGANGGLFKLADGGVGRVTIEGWEFDGNFAANPNSDYLYGIYCDAGNGAMSEIDIEHNVIHGLGAAAIATFGCSQVRFRWNEIYEVAQHATTLNDHYIMFGTSTAQAVSGFWFEDNHARGGARKGFAAFNNAAGGVSSVWFSRNRIFDTDLAALFVAGLLGTPLAKNVNATDNIVGNCYGGIFLSRVDGGSLKGNIVYDDTGTGQIVLDSCFNIELGGGALSNANEAAIATTGSQAATVSGITQANPGVITTPAEHKLSVDWPVVVEAVGGMVQINGKFLVNSVPSPTTLTLKTLDGVVVDTTGYGAFTAGGTITVASRGLVIKGVPCANPNRSNNASGSGSSLTYLIDSTLEGCSFIDSTPRQRFGIAESATCARNRFMHNVVHGTVTAETSLAGTESSVIHSKNGKTQVGGSGAINPTNTLSIAGGLSRKEIQLAIVNGQNDNIPLPSHCGRLILTGLTGAGSLTSIAGGTWDDEVVLANLSAQNLTIKHAHAAAALPENRFLSPGGGDYVIPAYGTVQAFKSQLANGWMVTG